MKNIFTFLAVILATMAFAQSPGKMSYQAVLRNNSNALVSNTKVGIKISILKDSPSGAIVYSETQNPTTNYNGLVTLVIGEGDVVSGSFSSVDWGNGLFFIKTETDLNGGADYTITGVSQLMSVPYAFHATTAERLSSSLWETDPLFKNSVAAGITATDTANWNNKLDSYTETDPQFTAWDKSSGISITESQISDLGNYIEIETDPLFNASVAKGITATDTTNWNSKLGSETDPQFTTWDKSTGVSITESQISDFGNYIETETDPLFNTSVAKGITATDTANWNNKLGSETDPQFTAWDKSAGISITESQISDFGNYIETETDPLFNTSVAKGITATDTANWNNKLDSYTETDPQFTAWDKSTGISITESQISDLGNYIETETDPLFNASVAKGITETDIINWNNKPDAVATTLGQAYSNGTTITANAGPVTVAGTDGLISTGTLGSGTILAVTGSGTRMMWFPKKAAFRAGYVESTQWDNANMGNASFAAGFNTTASAMYTTALGYKTTASGGYSTALGNETTAGSSYSTAMGYQTLTSGLIATVMGRGTTAQAYASTVLGQYNIISGNSNSWVSTDPVFIIGNGASASAPSNAVTVLKNGYTGIGTATPTTNLEVTGTVKITGGTPGTGKVLTSDANGLASWVAPSTATATTTLGQAYNNGATITTTATTGAVKITGTEGLISTGTFGSGVNLATVTGQTSQMIWYPKKAAFRVGYVDGTQWDNANIGDLSFATGGNSIASGFSSISLGAGTIASGSASIAMGNGTTSSGLYSTALGYATTASGQSSTALGERTIATAFASTAIGRYSIDLGGSGTTWVATDPLFIIGNGTGSSARSNALTVLKNGNLEVAGTVKIAGGSPGAGKVLTSDANGLASWATPATVAETDPVVKAINGIVKSNGAAISAATAGTDYITPATGSSLTSLPASTALYPTLNQNTTGSAAKLTTARTIQTNLAAATAASFDGSANITPGVTGVLPVANGGTGMATSGTPNLVFATAASGTTATAPSFRALSANDLPNSGVTAGTYNSLTVNAKGLVTAATNTTLTIGQSYQGGIIFWLDETGQHGLIAATADQGTGISWYTNEDESSMLTHATRDGIGAGMYNTERMIVKEGAGGSYLAQLCANYQGGNYGDWYLPSIYELNLLYQQRATVGGFAEGGSYWSSKEFNTDGAWVFSFDMGISGTVWKTYKFNVRAIRRF